MSFVFCSYDSRARYNSTTRLLCFSFEHRCSAYAGGRLVPPHNDLQKAGYRDPIQHFQDRGEAPAPWERNNLTHNAVHPLKSTWYIKYKHSSGSEGYLRSRRDPFPPFREGQKLFREAGRQRRRRSRCCGPSHVVFPSGCLLRCRRRCRQRRSVPVWMAVGRKREKGPVAWVCGREKKGGGGSINTVVSKFSGAV